MSSILSQAEAIRDETTAGANTATRVGTCFVDIANAIGILGTAPPYVGAQYTLPTNPTAIPTAGDFVLLDLAGSGTAIINDGFSDDLANGIITRDAGDPEGFHGLYHLQAIISASMDTGTHVITAAFGTDSAVDGATETKQTISAGAGKDTQICVNAMLGIPSGTSVALWVTENDHNGESLTVYSCQVTITHVAWLPI